eukprot:472802-Rhodomonas_salina.1
MILCNFWYSDTLASYPVSMILPYPPTLPSYPILFPYPLTLSSYPILLHSSPTLSSYSILLLYPTLILPIHTVQVYSLLPTLPLYAPMQCPVLRYASILPCVYPPTLSSYPILLP